jgi:hypothetical protein
LGATFTGPAPVFLVRFAAIPEVITLGASFVLCLITRQRRFLDFGWTPSKFALLFSLVFLALLVLERLFVA